MPMRTRQEACLTFLETLVYISSNFKCCFFFSLPIAAGALYVRKYFNEEARQNAIEMVADIRAEFEEILKKVDWMDEHTRKNALDKAKSMATHIAYPDELLDNKKLEEFYGWVRILFSALSSSFFNVFVSA